MNESGDGRRFFNKAERQALYLSQDGLCWRCGETLGEDWEADHSKSWKDGGETDVVNGRALCRKCNREKGSTSEAPLRLWQELALDKYTAVSSPNFLLVATPGAGKTRFAGEVIRNNFNADAITRLVIVVPTEHLKFQWADSLHALGVEIEPSWENSSGSWPSGMHGVAVTYSQVATNPLLLRRHVSDRNTFVVLDEIHHCRDNAGWGEAITTAFNQAVKRLLLSGTPFRTDNNKIPFVRYVDGKGVADHEYGYAEALSDLIVRPVYFPKIGGWTEWTREPGTVQRYSFDDDLSEQKSADRLRTAVTTEGWFIDTMKPAHQKLMEMRQDDDPDAAGIVWAIDYHHLTNFVAPLMRQVTGISPVVVASAEPESEVRLKAFANDQTPWIASIRMVAEGIDIPRLRVGVFATVIGTELFFRQAVGRLVRMEDEDQDAHFYIPDDPILREWAVSIKEEREHQLELDIERLQMESLGERASSPSNFVALGSLGENRGIVFDGQAYDPEYLDFVDRVKMFDPNTARIESALLAKFLHNTSRLPQPQQRRSTVPPEAPLYERKKKLAGTVNQLVNKLAREVGESQKDINRKLNQAIGVPSRKVEIVELESLELALATIQKWRADGEITTSR